MYHPDMKKQQELADFIKGVHTRLRLRSREVGPEAAWQEHCKDKLTLENYASTMKELATVHWEKNMQAEDSNQSRISWVVQKCYWYFFSDGKGSFLEKESKMSARYSLNCELVDTFNDSSVSLLDVGSCYNPLARYPNLKVTAVDLEPASEDVLRCDFLSVATGDGLSIDSQSACRQLPLEGYDVVLFSLVLQYMPTPAQRFAACRKACGLLKRGGLVLIVTPDSNHASANSRLVRQWRLALASIGLWLLATEKLKHVRCFTLAKAHDPLIVTRWLAMQKVQLGPEEAITMPHDKTVYDHFEKKETELSRTDSDNKYLADTFSQMIAESDMFVGN